MCNLTVSLVPRLIARSPGVLRVNPIKMSTFKARNDKRRDKIINS